MAKLVGTASRPMAQLTMPSDRHTKIRAFSAESRKSGATVQRRRLLAFFVSVAALSVFERSPRALGTHRVTIAPSSAPPVVAIPAGNFVMGSDEAERQYAYDLDAMAYGSPITREQRWYGSELSRHQHWTAAFEIARTPVTNAQYAIFVKATGYAPPDVDKNTWQKYGFIHPYERTRKFVWRDGKPPKNRENHPVVLVSWEDAAAYCQWISDATGRRWRLPTEAEWEKAARGTDGRYFPWGMTWDPFRLDSADRGSFDTAPVGKHLSGASPFGVMDTAGSVYQWTSTSAGAGRFFVKGGSWDDKGCGVCRPAARSSRPGFVKHIIVGFRVLREPQ